MSEKFQGQHRIPQIYLKQFGYTENSKWWISVWHRGDDCTKNVLIENFTKETNIFDLPYGNIEFRRHFENESNKKIEDPYRTVINNLSNQKLITDRTRRILCNVAANFICRAVPYRDFFTNILNSDAGRSKFIEEISLFNKDNLIGLNDVLNQIAREHHLNILSDYILKHLVIVFWSFNCVVLKDYGYRGWATSDNPVVIDKQNNYNWIIPIEAEIYFPLSKDYLLFMYHKKSAANINPLRVLTTNRIHSCEENIHKQIWDKIFQNNCRYLIFPTKLSETSLVS